MIKKILFLILNYTILQAMAPIILPTLPTAATPEDHAAIKALTEYNKAAGPGAVALKENAAVIAIKKLPSGPFKDESQKVFLAIKAQKSPPPPQKNWGKALENLAESLKTLVPFAPTTSPHITPTTPLKPLTPPTPLIAIPTSASGTPQIPAFPVDTPAYIVNEAKRIEQIMLHIAHCIQPGPKTGNQCEVVRKRAHRWLITTQNVAKKLTEIIQKPITEANTCYQQTVKWIAQFKTLITTGKPSILAITSVLHTGGQKDTDDLHKYAAIQKQIDSFNVTEQTLQDAELLAASLKQASHNDLNKKSAAFAANLNKWYQELIAVPELATMYPVFATFDITNVQDQLHAIVAKLKTTPTADVSADIQKFSDTIDHIKQTKIEPTLLEPMKYAKPFVAAVEAWSKQQLTTNKWIHEVIVNPVTVKESLTPAQNAIEQYTLKTGPLTAKDLEVFCKTCFDNDDEDDWD